MARDVTQFREGSTCIYCERGIRQYVRYKRGVGACAGAGGII